MKQDSDDIPLLRGWRVSKIEVVNQGREIDIEFTTKDHSPFRFRTSEFGVGGRNERTAALARFAARAGYGNVKAVFRYLRRWPEHDEGNVFPLGPLWCRTDDSSPGWSADLYPEYHNNSESVDVYPA